MQAYDKSRYVVLFVTTRSEVRLHGIMDAARRLTRNPQRRVFIGIALADFVSSDNPLSTSNFIDALGRRTSMIPAERLKGAGPRVPTEIWRSQPAFA
jgi:hypothetical protein